MKLNKDIRSPIIRIMKRKKNTSKNSIKNWKIDEKKNNSAKKKLIKLLTDDQRRKS